MVSPELPESRDRFELPAGIVWWNHRKRFENGAFLGRASVVAHDPLDANVCNPFRQAIRRRVKSTNPPMPTPAATMANVEGSGTGEVFMMATWLASALDSNRKPAFWL
jgi:hypothetical protein